MNPQPFAASFSSAVYSKNPKAARRPAPTTPRLNSCPSPIAAAWLLVAAALADVVDALEVAVEDPPLELVVLLDAVVAAAL